MPKLTGVNHRDAVLALERAGFRVARDARHLVMTDGTIATLAGFVDGGLMRLAAGTLASCVRQASPAVRLPAARISRVSPRGGVDPAPDDGLLSDRREGRCLLSYRTPGGWVAITKAVLTEVLGAGRDAKVVGLPSVAAEVLALTCGRLLRPSQTPFP